MNNTKQTKTKIHTRLKRLHQPRVRQKSNKNEGIFTANAIVPAVPEDAYDLYLENQHEAWLTLGAEKTFARNGDSTLLFSTSYKKSKQIGRYALSLGQHDHDAILPEGVLPVDCCFLDLETSGLRYSDVAFCIGLGWWQDGSFHVKQYTLAHEDDEKAQLSCALEVLSKAQALMTFNGRSFDLPRLFARFEHHQITHDLKDIPHVDLMYALRPLRKSKKYGLSHMEQDLLGFFREGDIPGHRAPALWSSYNQTGEIGQLIELFEHNRQDILSMVVLLGYLLTHKKPTTIEEKSTVMTQTASTVTPVAKKLGRTYQLRSKQQQKSGASFQAGASSTSRAPASTSKQGVGERVAQLRQQVEGTLGSGVGPAACLAQLAELVALAPHHPFGLKHLAQAYRDLGLEACAQSVASRLQSALPY